MTAPLDRAMESINSKVEEIYASEKIPTNLDLAKAAFESVDTNQLVQALVDDGWEWHNDELSPTDLREIALAVKNWLTGKAQQ